MFIMVWVMMLLVIWIMVRLRWMVWCRLMVSWRRGVIRLWLMVCWCWRMVRCWFMVSWRRGMVWLWLMVCWCWWNIRSWCWFMIYRGRRGIGSRSRRIRCGRSIRCYWSW